MVLLLFEKEPVSVECETRKMLVPFFILFCMKQSCMRDQTRTWSQHFTS